MITDIKVILENLKKAKYPEDVFGKPKTEIITVKTLSPIYRQLAKSCHEDFFPNELKPVATEAFILLQKWWEDAQKQIENKTYGKKIKPTIEKIKYDPIVFKLGKYNITLNDVIEQGSFSTVYNTLYDEPKYKGYGFITKVSRLVEDNSLLENEYNNLKIIQTPVSDKRKEEFFNIQRNYIPYPLKTFFLKGKNNVKKRANILTTVNDQCFTVQTLVEDKFDGKLPPEHAYWIFRRLLLTLWMSHLYGIIHGAVTPEHILVYPKQHGLILLDWTCSTKIGEKVKAYNPVYKQFISPEIFNKKFPTSPATDIYMAGMSMIYMLGGNMENKTIPDNIPDKVRTLIKQCVEMEPNKRPQDAEIFHNTFGSALGKRKFSPMIID